MATLDDYLTGLKTGLQRTLDESKRSALLKKVKFEIPADLGKIHEGHWAKGYVDIIKGEEIFTADPYGLCWFLILDEDITFMSKEPTAPGKPAKIVTWKKGSPIDEELADYFHFK